jgi:hypothetical protein
MAVLLKAIYRFNAIPIKIPIILCRKIKSILKFIWNKRSQLIKMISSKKSNVGGLRTPDFKLYHRTTVIKKASTEIDTKTNGTEDPEIKPHSYSHLIFDKGAKKHTLEKRQPLLQMMLRKLIIYMQKTEIRPLSHKNQLQMDQRSCFYLRLNILKLLQEKLWKI